MIKLNESFTILTNLIILNILYMYKDLIKKTIEFKLYGYDNIYKSS